MQKIIFSLFVLISLSISSCNKENNDELPDFGTISNSSFVGQWNWISTGGGITGKIHFGPKEFGERKLTLTNNSAFVLTENGNVLESGEYAIDEFNSDNGYSLDLISFPSVTLEEFNPTLFDGSISISNDLLLIGTGADGLWAQYLKEE